jgi:glycosyltransferase involved in cell wall biosynthesis
MSSISIDPSYTPVGTQAKTIDTTARVAGGREEKLALVIPTLHEGASLGPLLARVRAVLEPLGVPYEVVVVDDDSRDGTEAVVAAMALEDPRVRLLVRKGKRGLAGAILHGWESTDAGILGVMDADLQHPPELLPELLRGMLDGNDLVIGSRYARGSKQWGGNPLRRLISAVAVLATRPLQRPPLRASDPMSGFFIVRRWCVQGVDLRPTGFKLLLEIMVRGRIRSVREVPFVFGRRSTGSSKASLGVAGDYLLLLLSLYGRRFGFQLVEFAKGRFWATAFSLLLLTETGKPSGFFPKKKPPCTPAQCHHVKRKCFRGPGEACAVTENRLRP